MALKMTPRGVIPLVCVKYLKTPKKTKTIFLAQEFPLNSIKKTLSSSHGNCTILITGGGDFIPKRIYFWTNSL
jgi:hypothetical protein